jgi:uncharacterized protein (DUF1778 family)
LPKGEPDTSYEAFGRAVTTAAAARARKAPKEMVAISQELGLEMKTRLRFTPTRKFDIAIRQFAVRFAMPAQTTTARLEARLPVDVHALLKRAAEIEGRSLTDFVVAAASSAARKTIEDAEMIRLSVDDQQRFADALINPPPLAPAMLRAIERHRRLIGHPPEKA